MKSVGPNYDNVVTISGNVIIISEVIEILKNIKL